MLQKQTSSHGQSASLLKLPRSFVLEVSDKISFQFFFSNMFQNHQPFEPRRKSISPKSGNLSASHLINNPTTKHAPRRMATHPTTKSTNCPPQFPWL